MSSLRLNLMRVVLLVALLAAAAVTTPTASGDESPPAGPTLQGENLTAEFTGLTVTSNCNETGTSTVSYHAEGLAGPVFVGTFVADGTITIGPQVDEIGPVIAPILTLTETFTITSADTTITGSKTLTEPLMALGESERATCQDITAFGGITGTGRIVDVQAATTYEATIQSPLGTFMDSGRATPALDVVEITGRCDVSGLECSSNSATFDQLFTLSDQTAPPPPPPCDDDEDDDDQGGDDDDQGCDEDDDEQ